MADLRLAPAGPGQAVIVAADLRVFLRCAQGDQVELGLVAHVRLQALGRLSAIAGRPAPAVHLPQDILGYRPISLDRHVLEHPVGETELLRQQIEDLIIVLLLEARLDDPLAPLQRPVGSDARAGGLELRAHRQPTAVAAAAALARARQRAGWGTRGSSG